MLFEQNEEGERVSCDSIWEKSVPRQGAVARIENFRGLKSGDKASRAGAEWPEQEDWEKMTTQSSKGPKVGPCKNFRFDSK